jgi:hypothetical protein
MPQPGQLPRSLEELTFRNALSLETGRDFHQHMDSLIRSIDRMLKSRALDSKSSRYAPLTAEARAADETPAAEPPPPVPVAPQIAAVTAKDDAPEIIEEIKQIARDFFQFAEGRKLAATGQRQLLGPGDPVWISRTTDPQPSDVMLFATVVERRGFLVYRDGLPSQTSFALDRMRMEGKSIVPSPGQ